MPEIHSEYVVLGAGISGLTAAFELQERGKEVHVLEKEDRAGGALYSQFKAPFLFENGANSAANHPALLELIKALNLSSELLKASSAARKRFIARNGRLHEVSPSPKFLFGTSLLNWSGRLRLLAEPFIKTRSAKGETAEEFFVRRLGREAYNYLVNPVLGGIYAGNPNLMEFKAIMPSLYEWEKKYGSLFKGLRNSRNKGPGREIMSFKKGMATITDAIGQKLGDKLHLSTNVTNIKRLEDGFAIKSQSPSGKETQFFCKKLVWALPAHQADLMAPLQAEVTKLLKEIPYVPMGVLHLAFSEQVMPESLEGFGFLVPEQESRLLLGAIWTYSVFPERVPEGFQTFTLFVGGGRTPFSDQEEFEAHIPDATSLFKEYLDISADPTYQTSYFWSKAIPQYNGLHTSRVEQIQQECSEDLILIGNYLQGVSVGDCIQHAKHAIDRHFQ